MWLGSLRFLVAPDKFKGTLSAAEVAACITSGIRDALPRAQTTVLPVADGGDGTLQLALATGFELRHATVPASDGQRRVGFGLRGATAVLELASICGLHAPDVVGTSVGSRTTEHLGLVMRAALEAGARRLVVGLGGSASTDGGAGMLVALGARLIDAAGGEVAPTPMTLPEVVGIDLSGLMPAIAEAEIVFAVDVDAPLLGPGGAAHVFGPQKGASPATVAVLETAMAHWAKLVCSVVPDSDPKAPGTGAAGGTAFGGRVLGGQLRSGSDLCLDLAEFDRALEGADVVVTGEGRLDQQTLLGKVPVRVAQRARAKGCTTIAVVGARAPALTTQALAAHGFDRVYTLVDQAPAAAGDLELSRRILRNLGRQIAHDLNNQTPAVVEQVTESE